MPKIVADIEANGLLDTVTEIHCICMINNDNESKYSFGPDILDEALLVFDSNTTIIGHNFVDYDLAALKKVMQFDYSGKVIDTMLWSQYLYPERPGGHSLEAWGDRLGYAKVEYEDWSTYTPEMLHRCEVDTALTQMVYRVLCQEADEEIEGFFIPEYKFL